MTKDIPKHNVSISKSRRIQNLVIFILALCIIMLVVLGKIFDQGQDLFIGNWELYEPQNKSTEGFLIKNITINPPNKIITVLIQGSYYYEDWGPLVCVAKIHKGILELEPGKNFIWGGRESVSEAITQPFKIYYYKKYNYIVVGNAFYKKSGTKVEW